MDVCLTFNQTIGGKHNLTSLSIYFYFTSFIPSSVCWIAEHLCLAGRLLEQDQLVKTRDEGDKVIVLQRKKNNRGRFVILSVTPREGRGKHIIILAENFK